MAVKIVPGPDHPPPTTTAPPPTGRRRRPPPARRPPRRRPRRPTRTPPRRPRRSPPTTTTVSELERGWVDGPGRRPGPPGRADQGREHGAGRRHRVHQRRAGEPGAGRPPRRAGRPSVARHAGTGLLEVHVTPSANLANLNFVKVLLYCTECAPSADRCSPSLRPPVGPRPARHARRPGHPAVAVHRHAAVRRRSPTSCCCSCWPRAWWPVRATAPCAGSSSASSTT